MSKGRLLHLDNFWGQFCPSSAANDTFSPNNLDKSHILSNRLRSICEHMHVLLFSHSHTSSLTHIQYTHIHPNPNRDIIAPCKQNIPTTLCCLVRSDTNPPHKRNRKPGRKGFTKQFCGLLYKLATFVHLTRKNIRLYTPNINH